MESMLQNLKMMLGIESNDRDNLLSYILTVTSQRLINLLGLVEDDPIVPVSLSHVVVDVACARFNRIASEGMKSDSVEGESISFYDHDFDPYSDEIRAWLTAQDDSITGGKGKVRFL